MIKRIGILFALLLGTAFVRGSSAQAQLPPDQMTSLTLPEIGPGWIFVLDAGFASTSGARLDIIDGEHLKMLGQVSGGSRSNFVIAPAHHEIYSSDTFSSRGWRG